MTTLIFVLLNCQLTWHRCSTAAHKRHWTTAHQSNLNQWTLLMKRITAASAGRLTTFVIVAVFKLQRWTFRLTYGSLRSEKITSLGVGLLKLDCEPLKQPTTVIIINKSNYVFESSSEAQAYETCLQLIACDADNASGVYQQLKSDLNDINATIHVACSSRNTSIGKSIIVWKPKFFFVSNCAMQVDKRN